MNAKNVSVVFTGQIRERALFERSLGELAALPCVKELVLATWHGEARANQAYLQTLERAHGLRVVTATEPALEFDLFNGIRQAVSLRRGLDATQGAHYVLATRTDCHVEPEAVRYLAQKDRAVTDPGAAGLRVFREKVSVAAAAVYLPLHLDDRVLFGRHADLLRLCATDLYALRTPLSPAWRRYTRFHPPFMAGFPMFGHFLRHDNLFSAAPPVMRRGLLARACASPEFAVTLLAYYRVVGGLFCLDWNGHGVTHGGERAAPFDGAGEVALDPDLQCGANAFFLRAARGEIDSPLLGPALRAAGDAGAFVADPRDLGRGMDYAGFWRRLAAHGRQLVGFDAQLAALRAAVARQPDAADPDRIAGLLQFDPYDPELHGLLGAVHAARGNRALAAAYLRASLEHGGRHDGDAGRLLRSLDAAA